MNRWGHILTAAEIEAVHADRATIWPALARSSREFWESRTLDQLAVLEHQSWLCNESEAYQLARSYRALKASAGTRAEHRSRLRWRLQYQPMGVSHFKGRRRLLCIAANVWGAVDDDWRLLRNSERHFGGLYRNRPNREKRGGVPLNEEA